MRRSDRNFTKIPDGKLGIIALEGCKELGKTIDNYIIQWRSLALVLEKPKVSFANLFVTWIYTSSLTY